MDKLMNVLIEPKITLVGAGTGDPELITVKGLKALAAADVVLYDALINEGLLDYAPENAQKIYVGNLEDSDAFSQHAVNKLMVDYAMNYGHVVRLKSGDPFVFARGYEEVIFAESYAIPAEVVPGVSSALGIPAQLKIPMTYADVSNSFLVVSGNTLLGDMATDLPALLNNKTTIVVMMGIERVEEIAAAFHRAGYGRLPVAVVQNGSMNNEKIALGIADTIAELIAEKEIGSPALLVFGESVALSPEFGRLRNFYHDLALQERGGDW